MPEEPRVKGRVRVKRRPERLTQTVECTDTDLYPQEVCHTGQR